MFTWICNFLLLCRFEFICIPLVHPLFKREFISGVVKNRSGPLTRPDLVLCTSGTYDENYIRKMLKLLTYNTYFIDWNNLIIGKISSHIKVDAKDFNYRKNSEETLNQELSLASHLGLAGITLKLIGGIERNINLARIINDKLSATCNFQVCFFFRILSLICNYNK